MLIVIPMAGESRRFAEAGYDAPKYMLPLNGRTVFDHAVGSFGAYFGAHDFLFIYRDLQETEGFLRDRCAALGIAQAQFIELDQPTRGQAETVQRGLDRAGLDANDGLAIFNIDTFRPGFSFPAEWPLDSVDGYLEVFEGSGPNWSYVRPSGFGDGSVLETAEKIEISKLCCTGLYYFRDGSVFNRALDAFKLRKPDAPELYIAPIYNDLIAEGADIRYHLISGNAVRFCGVPAEYEALRAEESDG